MYKKNIVVIILVFFVIIWLVSYLSGLFIDVTRDAGKYAIIAKGIYQNGNFINLHVLNEPYDQKPPLLFWLGYLGFSIGGVSNFWFKFPAFILVLSGFYWAYRLGESLYNRKTGLITLVIIATSFIYALYSMDIHTDTPLQAFVTLALWQLFEFIKHRKSKNAFIGFLAIGLAMLSKGPVGAAIPAFAVVGHIVLKKDFKLLLDYRWYMGIVVALIVVSPALIGLMNQFGWEGIHFFFWENMVGRITGSYVNAVNDPIFYVHNLIYQLLPWSMIFFISAFMEIRLLIKNRFKSPEFFTFTGIWIYFIILNASESQLPNYVFSVVPLMAVLISKWIVIAVNENLKLYKFLFRVQHLIIAITWISIFVVSIYLFPSGKIFFWFLVVTGLLSSWYILRYESERLIKLIAPSAIVIICLIFLLNTKIYPYIFSFQASPKAARFFIANASNGDKLYNYKNDQYEIFFYSNPQAIELNSYDEMKAVTGKEGTWIYTNALGYQDFLKLKVTPDSVIQFQHFNLNRGAQFILPSTREKSLHPMYLIRF